MYLIVNYCDYTSPIGVYTNWLTNDCYTLYWMEFCSLLLIRKQLKLSLTFEIDLHCLRISVLLTSDRVVHT